MIAERPVRVQHDAAIALVTAVMAFKRADTELRRAEGWGDADRLWRAGNRYATARYRMFQAADLANRPGPVSIQEAERHGE